MTVVVRPEILSSLNSVREDVQRQVAGLDRYRALKAIEQTIADFPSLEDLTRSLADIRDRVQSQLDETREYRALRTIERIMPELSDVLALLAERPDTASESKFGLPHVENGPVSEEPLADEQVAAISPQPEPEPITASEFEAAAVEFVETAELTAEPAMPATQAYREETAVRPPAPLAEAAHEARPPEPAPESEVSSKPGAVPSLADSVAQLMAQSIAPPPREAQAPPQQVHERSDAAPPHTERAA